MLSLFLTSDRLFVVEAEALHKEMANGSLRLALEAARYDNLRRQADCQSDSSQNKASALFLYFGIYPTRYLPLKNGFLPASPIVILIVFVKRSAPSALGSADLKAHNHLLPDQELAPGVI